MRRPKPITTSELKDIQARFGKDRLVRVLLWEISRLRDVVKLLYQQICRDSRYSDKPQLSIDEEVEQAIDQEPVIQDQHTRRVAAPVEAKPRRPHLTAEQEAKIATQMAEGDAVGKSRT